MHEDERQRAVDWLVHLAEVLGYTVHLNLIQANEPWLYVLVHVNGGKDAYDKAAALQKLEDAWNRPRKGSRPYWKLLLLPAPAAEPLEQAASAAAVADK